MIKGLVGAIKKALSKDKGNFQYSLSEDYKPAREIKKGGKVKSASQRADGIAIRGKTRA